MDPARAYIVSDLHLGSEFFRSQAFTAWLRQLPAGAQVVLNGDVIDAPEHVERLPYAHRQVLDLLAEQSHQRPVYWVYGNHDEGLHLNGAGAIRFVDRWSMDKRLLAVHGHDLDTVMPRHSAFKWVFRRLHRLLIFLGASRVHVAQYAKKWRLLYDVLNRHVAHNAARAAHELGFEAIVCGHTHAAMDTMVHGIRYLNTGAWTEPPLCYVVADAHSIRLEVYDGEAN